jgi:hypothetical protein
MVVMVIEAVEQVVPGHRQVGGFLAAVDESVIHPRQPLVVDPDPATQMMYGVLAVTNWLSWARVMTVAV